MSDPLTEIRTALAQRFSDPPEAPPGAEVLTRMAAHASHRDFTDQPVDEELIRLLAAVALSSPTKSDLQQRDIINVADPGLRRELTTRLDGQDWVGEAPALLVFCGNNHRQRLMHSWRERPFVNDHLDAFFNAAVDAAIALGAFVTAAEALGLGCCPVSAIRNHAQEVSDLLALPQHVFPVAGLALGWPDAPATLQQRLPLAATLHRDRFDDASLRESVEAYDRHRAEAQPYASQRFVEEYGHADPYGWTEDKARQYSKPERANFGQFVRDKGFNLD
jgi:nitroreductase